MHQCLVGWGWGIDYSIDASSPCKTDQSTCTVTSGNHRCIRTTLSDSRLRPAPPLPEGHSNQSHSDTETVRSLASSGSCIERAWVAKNIVFSRVVDRLCMILIGLDLDGINILRPVQVSSHSGPTTRCATRKSSARTLSKIRSVCMALRKINKNIYQSQRNVRIKCISLRCIAKQEIERQVNHVWKLFNVWQNHNMKFQTRTHIHTHTHALRGAHTHGHTYMHRHTHTYIYIYTHTLYSRNDDTRGHGHFLHSQSRQMTWTKMSWTRLSTTADAGMQTGWSHLDWGKTHERLKKSLLWVRRLWRLWFVAMLWSIANFMNLWQWSLGSFLSFSHSFS